MNRHRAATTAVVVLLLLIIISSGCSIRSTSNDPPCLIGHDHTYGKDGGGNVTFVCDLYLREKPHA